MKTSEFESTLRKQVDRAHLSISSDFVARAERYYNLLRRWSKRTNLTALPLDGYPAKSIDRLLVEPLRAAELVPLDAHLVCFDIGSGGGSPAIPFALARPLLRLVMVESIAKKAAFLREAVRAVELKDAEVITGRAEDVSASRPGSADLILSRGVLLTETLSNALLELMRPGGRLFVFGGSRLNNASMKLVERCDLGPGNELQVFQALPSI